MCLLFKDWDRVCPRTEQAVSVVILSEHDMINILGYQDRLFSSRTVSVSVFEISKKTETVKTLKSKNISKKLISS